MAQNGLDAFLGGLFNPAARDQNQRMLEASRAVNTYKPYGGAQSSMRSALSAAGGGRPNTDDVINSTFGSMAPDVLNWPGVSASGSASSHQSGMTKRGLPVDYRSQYNNWVADNALKGAGSQRLALNSSGQIVQPIGGKKPLEITVNGGNPALSNIPIPRMRPSFGDPIWTATNGVDPYPASYNVIPATGSGVKVASGMPGPTLDDLLAYAKGLPDETAANPAVAAATAAGQPVTNVTAAMKPPSRGGLFDMLFGPSKNGMGGLAGLMGGPGSGGIVGMLLDPRNNTPAPAKTGPSGVGTNGYSYQNGQNMGYSDAEKAKRAAQGQAIGDANRKNPNPTYSKSGENNSFMPKSYQNSVRQQTGY